jgi:hypothetical protein
MLDYRSLLIRRPELAGKTLVQHVVVLGSDPIEPGVHDNQVDYDFVVHYVRDEHVDRFLGDPALAPFAVLADVPEEQRPAMLQRAAELIIDTVPDDHLQNVLLQATLALAGIRLDPATIKTTLEELMPVPSVVEEIAQLYREEARQEALQEGLEQGREQAITVLLRHRFAEDDRIPAIARRLATVPIDQSIPRIDTADGLDDLIGPD